MDRLVGHAPRSIWQTYGVAVMVPVLALIVRLPFTDVLADKVPYITFFLATAVSASYGGLGPGLVSTLLGGLLGGLYIVQPIGSLAFVDAGDYWGLLLFFSFGSFISHLSGQLHAVRRTFQQTLLSIGDGVIATDREQRITLMNGIAGDLTGWKPREARGRPVGEVFRIVREGSDTPAEIPSERILKTGKVVGLANHTELIKRNGERIPIDDSGAPIFNESGQLLGAVLVFRDITERRRAEIELSAAERRASNILASISDGFFLLNHEWRYARVNPTAEKIIGLSAEEILGKNHWELHPATVGTQVETLYRKALDEGVSVHFENCYEPWDRWFDITAYPSSEGLAVYFREITERKRSEAALRRLTEDLTQFTFAASHDIREPLRTMSVSAQLLQRKLSERLDQESHTWIDQIVTGAQRISRLLNGLLQFSRIGETAANESTRVNTSSAAKEALADLQALIEETQADIFVDSLPSVMSEHALVCQIFQNLIANSLKYRTPTCIPKIRISAACKDGMCTFAVKDNGIGIAAEHHERIFLPFKRLHGAEIAGAGIGLATCKRIVERYGGRIWVESAEGEGCTFYFSLPVARESSHA